MPALINQLAGFKDIKNPDDETWVHTEAQTGTSQEMHRIMQTNTSTATRYLFSFRPGTLFVCATVTSELD